MAQNKAKTMLSCVDQSTINEAYIAEELQLVESRALQGSLENGDHNTQHNYNTTAPPGTVSARMSRIHRR